jgi:hypothetical protein
MSFETLTLLTVFLFLAAMLYSSVGHGGASAYLAMMALLSVTPEVMKPMALVLNIFVSSIAAWKFYRAGFFSWPVFLPFTLPAIPAAFVGGLMTLPSYIYNPILGIVLLIAAIRFFVTNKTVTEENLKQFPLWLAVLIGVMIGFLSGLTGVGGGIFLTPLLLFFSWAETKKAAGISALFILVNSISGLLGQLPKIAVLPNFIFLWILAVLIGGFIGAEFGSRRLQNVVIYRLLAAVLIIASVKMLLTG